MKWICHVCGLLGDETQTVCKLETYGAVQGSVCQTDYSEARNSSQIWEWSCLHSPVNFHFKVHQFESHLVFVQYMCVKIINRMEIYHLDLNWFISNYMLFNPFT
jgi:hypothetical protein